ncbi:hypothetical protein EGW08_019442, partial [Elysia chlorotica]
ICTAFNPETGACENRKHHPSICHCQRLYTGAYRISYIFNVTVAASNQSVYMLWAGKPDIRTENQYLPEVKRVSVTCIPPNTAKEHFDLLFLHIFSSITLIFLLISWYIKNQKFLAKRKIPIELKKEEKIV